MMMNPFSVSETIERISRESLAVSSVRRPLIGVTGNFDDGRLSLLPGYYRSLEVAGADVVVIPPRRCPDASLLSLLERLDGILFSGGGDVNPLFWGEEPRPALHAINSERDAFEYTLVSLAYARQIPILGICRGMQIMVAALGGTVCQDLAEIIPADALLKHSQDASRGTATHTVAIVEDSLLGELFGQTLAVNSYHHQAVVDPGPRFRTTAFASDGVVEAIEAAEGADKHWAVGVQWHPECFLLEGDDTMTPLFQRFATAARAYRSARDTHQTILTLDSHCDTPMWFDRGIDLARRNNEVLVDFPKMKEGGLDATIMAAYIPQGNLDEAGHQDAFSLADRLLDEVKSRVDRVPGVEIAYTPANLYERKSKGLLSVMVGIENGYAIGEELEQLDYFRRKGVVYMTLCHNGDNLICDSACKSRTTHNGLSPFGRKVIERMNRIGMMVDLSHASERSFYEALETSRQPIVCSHSSARALCNHPRNLTDDQLKALARSGGVAQTTCYAGFLRAEDEGRAATIDDFVAHLLHMIAVAGIDHAGVGTDFDGDGGVPGMAGASELINLTIRLRAEGFTTDDLNKVWGGNFLRVMTLCQKTAVRD